MFVLEIPVVTTMQSISRSQCLNERVVRPLRNSECIASRGSYANSLRAPHNEHRLSC